MKADREHNTNHRQYPGSQYNKQKYRGYITRQESKSTKYRQGSKNRNPQNRQNPKKRSGKRRLEPRAGTDGRTGKTN